ncbi:MAG: STAS/SEC14 domain-containing protein [Tenuifilaceae bacterium]
MERGSFIVHNDKEIYFIDYTNLKQEEEFLEAIKSTNAFREKVQASGKKDLLMLVDVTNSYIYGQVFSEIKRSAKLTQDITRRTAVVGVTGVKKTLLDMMNTFTTLNVKSFDNIQDAKNWLVR